MSAQANPKNYLKVLWALFALTIVTVAISRMDLGRGGNITVGLLVATIKATLVVLFFMHLKYEARWWAGVVLFPLTLVLIIIFANLPDTGFGDFTTTPAKDVHPAGKAAH